MQDVASKNAYFFRTRSEDKSNLLNRPNTFSFINHLTDKIYFKTEKIHKDRNLCGFLGALEGTRTPDLLVRSQSLYPAELWAHFLLRTVVLTTITIISHLLQLVKRFFEFFSGFSKKVCIARNFGVFCLGEWQKGQTQCICCQAKTDLTNRRKSLIIKVKRAHQ